MEANIYTQNIATVNGRNISHYLVDTPVGQINIVQYEKPSKEIVTELIYNDYEKAERKFSNLCKKIADGKI